MSVNNKRVFYVKYLAHEIYADILRARPDVRLDRLENESPDEIAAPILAAAHAYQVGAARDELAPHFHVHADLLRFTFESRRNARSASRMRFDRVSSIPSACSATELALPPD